MNIRFGRTVPSVKVESGSGEMSAGSADAMVEKAHAAASNRRRNSATGDLNTVGFMVSLAARFSR